MFIVLSLNSKYMLPGSTIIEHIIWIVVGNAVSWNTLYTAQHILCKYSNHTKIMRSTMCTHYDILTHNIWSRVGVLKMSFDPKAISKYTPWAQLFKQ